MAPATDVRDLLRSPVFAKFAFPSGGATQYADAMLRATFPQAWLAHAARQAGAEAGADQRAAGYGYVLTSKKTGLSFAVVDVEFLQKELFKQIPKQDGKLVIAVTHNTTYYADGDATECCSWGTHGVDSATGNSFVLGSYLRAAPAVVADRDVQPLTQQLAEFVNDPLHDPLLHGRNVKQCRATAFPGWLRSRIALRRPGRCGGTGVATSYFLLEPTNTNPKNNIPASKALWLRRAAGVPPAKRRRCCPGNWRLPAGGQHLQFSGPRPRSPPPRGPARRADAGRPHRLRLTPTRRRDRRDGRAQWPQADRLLGPASAIPAPRRFAAVGHHHRGVRRSRSQRARRHHEFHAPGRTRCRGVQGRYRPC